MADRTLKAILVVIAFELGWLLLVGPPSHVAAQSGATPVIVRGFDVDGSLPVVVRGLVTIVPSGPLKIEADKPLLVENVPYTPSPRPGE